jgi:Spy/CpxP family protein refolding chaperone
MAVSRSRLLRIALVISLALNVFVAAAIVADAVTHRGWVGEQLGFRDRRPDPFGVPSPRRLRGVLSEPDRAILEATMETHRPRFRDQLKGMFEARRAVADAVRAEPFDQAKLRTAFADLQARHGALASEAQEMLSDLVGRLGPEGRAKIAELLTERHRRGK